MPTRFPLFAVLLFAVLAQPSTAEVQVIPGASERVTRSLNGEWAVEGETIDRQVSVPTVIPLQQGVTTWRREFTLQVAKPADTAFLEFGGIVNTGSVRVNGVPVGELLAFTRTRLDVADALNWSGSNTIEVALDDRLTSETVPGGPIEPLVEELGPVAYTIPAAWENAPGIVRPVSLVYSPRPMVLDAFAVQELNADLTAATVDLRLKVAGAPAERLTATVGLARNGELVTSCIALSVADDELACTLEVDAPTLWSPDAPNLYDIWIGLYDELGLTDSVRDRTGLRRFEIRGNQFYLNNEPLFLRGITRHGIYDERGFVADERTMREDLVRIKALGVNYIRAIHYPPDPRFAEFADELGILLSEEIPAWAFLAGLPELQVEAVNMFRAMVERDFNHPSVVIWYAGNGGREDGRELFPKARAAVSHIENQRPMSYIFDDLVKSPSFQAGIDSHVGIVYEAGMDFYGLNLGTLFFPELAEVLPTDMPVVPTEWSGSEGSNRGPVGDPGVIAFPAFGDIFGTGEFPEWYQAWTMLDSFQRYEAYADCATISPCIAGMAFFNWQDVPWPAYPHIVEGHYPFYRSGLTYPDREGKTWPLATFQILMGMLP